MGGNVVDCAAALKAPALGKSDWTRLEPPVIKFAELISARCKFRACSHLVDVVLNVSTPALTETVELLDRRRSKRQRETIKFRGMFSSGNMSSNQKRRSAAVALVGGLLNQTMPDPCRR
ncbi:hypothetical protein Bra5_PB00219 (plasmid) [Rhizobium phaseoli Brasil 5]|nr:hypothetical protein Bra5_PB00219 [Rhizobium phaseoli Brasil 5]